MNGIPGKSLEPVGMKPVGMERVGLEPVNYLANSSFLFQDTGEVTGVATKIRRIVLPSPFSRLSLAPQSSLLRSRQEMR